MVLERDSAKSYFTYFVIAIFALLFLKVVLNLMGIDLKIPVFEPALQFIINQMRTWAEYTKQLIGS